METENVDMRVPPPPPYLRYVADAGVDRHIGALLQIEKLPVDQT